MNHKASIYSNTVMPSGLYYCKLLDLHLDTSDRPYLWTSLVTGSTYEAYADVKLSSIIYRTPKSEELIAKFQATFRITGADDLDSYLEALGRWGCVSVTLHDYQSTEFSCVSFVRQNGQMRFTSIALEKREQMGENRTLFLPPSQQGRPPQKIPLADFTLILATNNEHSIVPPLRDRMKLTFRFDYYLTSELVEVVKQRARRLGWEVEEAALQLIAARGRGTPRIALRLLEACRRVCRSLGESAITMNHFQRACQLEGLDGRGLDRQEVQILRMLDQA